MRRHKIIRVSKQRIAFTNTSAIPDADIRKALRWLVADIGIDLDAVVFHFKHAGTRRSSYGLAYPGMPGLANLDGLKRWEWSYLVTVTDGRGHDWVRTLAHEAKHVEQFKAGQRGSEPPAVAFAAWAAERWR